MHAIRTADKEGPQDVAKQMMEIANASRISRGSESNLGNGTPLAQILEEKATLIDPMWTEEEQETIKPLVQRNTSWGTS